MQYNHLAVDYHILESERDALQAKLDEALEVIERVLPHINWLKDYPDNTAPYNDLQNLLSKMRGSK